MPTEKAFAGQDIDLASIWEAWSRRVIYFKGSLSERSMEGGSADGKTPVKSPQQ